MKRTVVALVLGLMAVVAASASGKVDELTVEGKIAVVGDNPSIVATDGTVWNLPAMAFYKLAWENGIKVGDAVKAEGFDVSQAGGPGRGRMMGRDGRMGGPGPMASGSANAPSATNSATTGGSAKFFMPQKVWINGKEIDLSKAFPIGDGRMGGDGPCWDDDQDDDRPRGNRRSGR